MSDLNLDGLEALAKARDEISAMLLHFTATPSTLADSIARGRGHKAIGAINEFLAAARSRGVGEAAREVTALRAFVRELSCLQPECIGQRQSIKERAEDLCEQWGITG